jgi:hypothetical protein
MSSVKRITLASVAALAVSSWASWALAGEPSTPSLETPSPVPIMSVIRTETPEAAAFRRNPFGSKPLGEAALSAKRGGDRVINDSQLKGVVADNQASNLTTGMNVISDGAFAGSAGLSTVIQNSGNNVLIQNATIVNVQLK